MYTIIMNDDKSLSKTVVKTLFQGEKLVDKFRFLIPQSYNSMSLAEFTTTLKYIDPGNVLHSEKLTMSDELYNGSMLCFYLPVDSELTRFAGEINIHLVLTKSGDHLMHSGETSIQINAVDPCYQHTYNPSDRPNDDDSSTKPSEDDGFEVVEF